METTLTEFAADLLENDTGGHGRSRLMAELQEMENDLRYRLNKGVPPEEASRIQSLNLAITAARNIVDQIWNFRYNS